MYKLDELVESKFFESFLGFVKLENSSSEREV